jgi:phage baseplate assembly protein W
MHYDNMDTTTRQALSDTARARLRELEARAALVRLQAEAGVSGSAFVAERAEAFRGDVLNQLSGATQPAREQQGVAGDGCHGN